MTGLALAALVGVLHVHHAPSHDSEAPFSDVLAAAHEAELDFVVLAEHVPEDSDGPLPGAELAGTYTGPDGRELRVLVGGEFGTTDGHLVGYQLPRAFKTEQASGRQAIDEIHRLGGFAVVPHPFTFGGWHAWDAPFDAIEVHNGAAELRDAVGLALPFRLLQMAFSRRAAYRGLLGRPDRALATWDRLRAEGRDVIALSGSDVHQNVSVLGWQIDPYAQVFQAVQMHCPEGPLTEAFLWAALREGRCAIRWSIFDDRAAQAERVRLESGRVEHWLSDGSVVLEIEPTGRARTP